MSLMVLKNVLFDGEDGGKHNNIGLVEMNTIFAR